MGYIYVCKPPLCLKSMRYHLFNIFTIIYRATEYIRVQQILGAWSAELLDFLISAQIFSTVTTFCVISSFRCGVNDVPSSSGMLRSSDWYLVADVSGHRVSPILLDRLKFEDGTETLSRSIRNYQSILSNIIEEQKPVCLFIPSSMYIPPQSAPQNSLSLVWNNLTMKVSFSGHSASH
jgi:hypothetical protein